MRHFCECGRGYLIIPKDVPLNERTRVVCACGLDVKARWSSQFFDYQPFCEVWRLEARETVNNRPQGGQDEDEWNSAKRFVRPRKRIRAESKDLECVIEGRKCTVKF
jgi:hypothetical protein